MNRIRDESKAHFIAQIKQRLVKIRQSFYIGGNHGSKRNAPFGAY